jgi:HSP20 family protein
MLPSTQRSSWSDPFTIARRDFDNLLGQFFNPEAVGTVNYPVDITEDADNLYVTAELPGFTKDEIDVSLEKGILSILAERKVEAETKEKSSHLKERRAFRYARRFSLPTSVEDAKVAARLENGLLHLTLPKKAEVKPRRIEVK